MELILTTLLVQGVNHYGQKRFTWFDATTRRLAEEAAAANDEARATARYGPADPFSSGAEEVHVPLFRKATGNRQ